jgi:ADP-heptose:LPS heptosyltransferase
VQSSGLGARLPITTKQWPPERMQQVVAALLQDGHHVVQVGLSAESPLPGAMDLRGKLSLRETGAVLSQSRLFIGLVGGLMHMARAVDCRAVIVYGGRELAALSGYRANVNLATSPACAPCYLRNMCPHDLVCLTEISAEAVVRAARSLLHRDDPPENETASI